jgi:hypothetical protein
MLSAFAWGIALDAVVVRGTSACPSPTDVEAKLAPLVISSNGPPDVAEIVRQDTTLTVSLTRPDGRAIGRQTLDGHRCDDLAEAAAVILASWENDARSEGLSLTEAPPPAPQPERPRARAWDVALGGGAGLAGGSISPEFEASGSVAFARRWLGLRAGGGVAGFGTVELPHGRVRWTRFVFGGGPKLVWSPSSLVVEGHLGGYGGWVRSAGEGFADSRNDGGFEFSLVGALRVAGAGSGLRPWLEASLAFWPSPVVAYELPSGDQGRLPALEFALAAGILLGR